MGFPHMIILHGNFKTVHCYEETNQNILNFFSYIYLGKESTFFSCLQTSADLVSIQAGFYPNIFLTHYVPSIPFLGSWQAVQTQNAASDQDLHCLLTQISNRNKIKMKKYTRRTPLKFEMDSSK